MSDTDRNRSIRAPIFENRSAKHHYNIIRTLEAGIVLEGWEVKSIRSHKLALQESYVHFRKQEAFWSGAHISPLKQTSSHRLADPKRERKLLMHRKELQHLQIEAKAHGSTIIVLNLHWKGRLAKLLIGLAKGKKLSDKRAGEKLKDWKITQSHLMKKLS